MSWALIIYTPLGGPHVAGSQIASYSASSPGGIVDGFHWSSDPYGNCLQLEFSAVPRMVNIPPRAIVQLIVNNIPAFYGYITRSWPTSMGRAERYVASGAVQLLRQRYANVDITSTQDIAQIVHAVMGFCHPAIRYIGAPPNTGFSLSSFKAPWVDIATILKDLSGAAAGVPYGVGADGTFFFYKSTSTTAVKYVDANVRHLPVEGAEVADIVRLFHPETGSVYSYDAGLGYGAERTVIVPQMHNYMSRVAGTYQAPGTVVTDLYGTTTTLNQSWLQDEDQTTGHTISRNPPSGLLCNQVFSVTGIDFSFTAQPGMDLMWRVQAVLVPLESPNYPQSRSLGMKLRYVTQSLAVDRFFGAVSGSFTIPTNADQSHTATITLGGYTSDACTPFRFTVYQFAVYTPNTILVQLASSLVRSPYQTPSEIHIPGFTLPTTHISVLGTPSGNVTGPVSVWEYVYTVKDGISSVARIGSTGSAEEANVIKVMATQISAEGDTRLRW